MLVVREPEEQEDATNDQPISSPTPLTPPPQQPQDVPSTSHAQSPSLQPHSPTPTQTQDAYFPMKVVAAVSETVSVAAVIPSVVPETVSADAAISTVTDPPVI
nr:hypothetical protein [Tanacetum cinerariifolium]